jgi:chloramphenicol-sensitive protein RarD
LNKATLIGAAAYTLWGFFPLYLRTLIAVPAWQITAHRVVWACGLLLVLSAGTGKLKALRAVRDRRAAAVFLGMALLLGVNWLTFVWAVNSGRAVEASLGYFINPLVNVLLGMIFLEERLRRGQWLAVGLAATGVIYLTVRYGSPPWVALILAVTFAFYGLLKKRSPLAALPGLTLETTLMLPAALAYLVWAELNGIGAFGHMGTGSALLLAGTGAVTAAPLLLFAVAARTVPLSTLGLLQYISPSIQFVIGVLLFAEPFTAERAVGYGLTWLALVVFTLDGLRRRPGALLENRETSTSRIN